MEDLDELEAAEVLVRAESGVLARRRVELEELRLVSRWAELHGSDPREAPGAPPRRPPGSARLEEMGGDGTPLVQDLCLDELAVARRTHVLTQRAATADVLDLQHRLPRVWRVVCRLECEAWVARRVAVMSRSLDRHQVRLVDAAIADCIATSSPSRVLAIAEAKVIEADPVAHAARVRAEQERRYVALTRTDEAGLRTVIARVEAGEAVWVEATVNRVAEILVARGDDRARDVVRATAFGYLGRPAELLRLLLEHAGDELAGDEPPEPDEPSAPGEPAEPEGAADPPTSRALAFPADLLPALRACDPARLRPSAVLYLHLHEAGLEGGVGVARGEAGIGPRLLCQLKDLLGHTNVVVKGVIDLTEHRSVNHYEVPEWLKERVHLQGLGDVFPHATGVSRGLDGDHVEAYDANGPPGQTSTDNIGLLGRFHHRTKTHQRGWLVRKVGARTYLWRSPHGLWRLVDPTGTHVVDPGVAG